MSNQVRINADSPLPPDDLSFLRQIIDRGIHDNLTLCAEDIGVGKSSLLRAAAGQPIRPATRRLIGIGLARMRAEWKCNDAPVARGA